MESGKNPYLGVIGLDTRLFLHMRVWLLHRNGGWQTGGISGFCIDDKVDGAAGRCDCAVRDECSIAIDIDCQGIAAVFLFLECCLDETVWMLYPVEFVS